MKSVGMQGEQKAAEWLVQQGYTIVARNWRTQSGEIDIIVSIGHVLVFVEVKTMLRTDISELAIIVGEKKQQRICETAKHFLAIHREYNHMVVRFDVIVLQKNPFLNAPVEPIHLVAAFGESYEIA